MKFSFSGLKHTGSRPYWHKDAKWICAIVLTIMLAISLPVISLYRLTGKVPATNALAYTMAGLTSPQGIDSTSGIKDLQNKVAKTGSTTVNIAGIPVVFTAHDFKTLSPRDLRLKVFGSFANQFYDKGARGLIKSQGFSNAAADQFQKNSSTIGLFTKSAHSHIGKIMTMLLLADILLAAGVVYFSFRFGRLASLGLVMLAVGLPALSLAALSSQHHIVSGTARADAASSTTSMIGTFLSFVAPLVLPYFSGTYMVVFASGAVLLAAAAIGRIIFKFRVNPQSKSPQP